VNDANILVEQSKNKGLVVVNQIMQLTNEVDALKDQKDDIAEQLKNINEDDSNSVTTRVLQSDLIVTLEAKEAVIARLESQIKSKTNKLKLGDPTTAAKLDKMKNDDWFNIQLNLRALKDRIISKIREHKFEVANLDRAVRTQAMGKLHSAVHRSSGLTGTA
jgi:hypothetical protein